MKTSDEIRFDAPRLRARHGLRLVLPLIAALSAMPAWAGSDLRVHGLLDLAVSGRGDGFDSNLEFRGDSRFDAYGLRVFADASASPQFHLYAQAMFNDATTVHVDGAYVLYTPSPTVDLHAMAGKIPWLIGTWGPRTYSDKNPLIGTPLMYQHHTTLLWYAFPSDAANLLASAGTGQYGVAYDGGFGARGMAIVDDSYWDFGIMLTGSRRPLEGAFGFVNGSPGWPSTSQDDNGGKTLLGRVGLAPLSSLRVGVSGAYGPYLNEFLDPYLPAGHSVHEYHQWLRMADAEFLLGHVELRSEGFLNTWETPTVGDLKVRGGYVEGKVTVMPGVHVAGRWDVMRFGDVIDSTGAAQAWDHGVVREEWGIGYRASRGVLAKAIHQRNIETIAPGRRKTSNLLGAQLSIAF